MHTNALPVYSAPVYVFLCNVEINWRLRNYVAYIQSSGGKVRVFPYNNIVLALNYQGSNRT